MFLIIPVYVVISLISGLYWTLSFFDMVPRARIELALPKKPDFESGASTNSATPAIFIIFTYQPDVIESGAVTRKYVPDIFNRIYPYIRLGHPVLHDTRASCTSSTNSATPAIFIIFTYQPDVIESGAVTRKYVPDIFNRIYPYIRLGHPVLRDTRASCTSSTNSAITC